jgi:Putative Ig domain
MLAFRNLGFRSALLVCLSVSTLLSGCGGGGDSSPGASSGSSTSSSTSSSSPPTSTGTSAPAITLSGTPPTTVVVGSPYVFQPSATTTSGTATFSATGLPGWASLNSSTGEVSGTPTASYVGTTAAITISASDGSATASLAPFKIAVTAAPAGSTTGSATLSWTIPTDNTNGTVATNLAGFHIYYGTTPGALKSVITVSGTETTKYEISNLSAGTYYFEVAAYNSQGVDGVVSNEGSKTI